jgi:hypothetical protein
MGIKPVGILSRDETQQPPLISREEERTSTVKGDVNLCFLSLRVFINQYARYILLRVFSSRARARPDWFEAIGFTIATQL